MTVPPVPLPPLPLPPEPAPPEPVVPPLLVVPPLAVVPPEAVVPPLATLVVPPVPGGGVFVLVLLLHPQSANTVEHASTPKPLMICERFIGDPLVKGTASSVKAATWADRSPKVR
jgi:hypothetical protein